MLMFTPIRIGIGIGLIVSLASGLAYIEVLHEPGSAFYPFAAVVFVGGPAIGGILAALTAQEGKVRAFLGSGTIVFGGALALFIVTYVVLPQSLRANVQLPGFCDGFDGRLDLPSNFSYPLPDGNTGILLTENAESAVAATIDGDGAPLSSTMYLIRKSDNMILRRMRFDNDVITASIDEGTVYIFNDKLGYLIDEHSGELEENLLLIDNYGGLTETDRPFISRASSGNWYLETTGVVSSWNIDGTVKSRPHLTFSGIARGCYVSGASGEVVQL